MEEQAVNGTDYDGKCFITHSAVYNDALKVADKSNNHFLHL